LSVGSTICSNENLPISSQRFINSNRPNRLTYFHFGHVGDGQNHCVGVIDRRWRKDATALVLPAKSSSSASAHVRELRFRCVLGEIAAAHLDLAAFHCDIALPKVRYSKRAAPRWHCKVGSKPVAMTAARITPR
jgi:hypothetical protein